MKAILGVHLFVLGAEETIAFQFQPSSSFATRKLNRSVHHRSKLAITSPSSTFTRLYSSFSDLSGKDEQDDKIQILLDSLDSLRTTPKEPEPIEEPEPMDEMVEKMAMPLKFFKGKDDKKSGDDKIAVVDDKSGDNTDSKAAADASPTSSVGDSVVKVDTPASATLKTADEESKSVVATELPIESSKSAISPSESSPPVAIDKTPAKSIMPEKITAGEEKPSPAATVLPDQKSDTTTIQKTQSTEVQETGTDIKATTEEKPSENMLFRKIFDRSQVIDQPSESSVTSQLDADKVSVTSQSDADKVSDEDATTAQSSIDESSIDSNLKALIQTIQPSMPTLPSFAPPDLGTLEFSLVGGAIIIISLYLSLAAYLRGVDKDEGYAEWDQYKRKDGDEKTATKSGQKKDVDTAMDVGVGTINGAADKSAPYGLINKGQNPFVSNTVTTATKPTQPTLVAEPISSSPPKTKTPESVSAQQLERLDKLEKDTALVESIIASSVTPSSAGDIEVQKIEEYCEPAKVNPECSESISSYLGSLAEQKVEEGAQKAAAQKIISYLDSLSSSTAAQRSSFSGTVPQKSKIVARKEPSETSAAFSSYLDALSTGSVSEPPTAKAVAGYLDVLSSEAKSTLSTPNEAVASRIVEVEDRLNRLESSVAGLPDAISSRLIGMLYSCFCFDDIISVSYSLVLPLLIHRMANPTRSKGE
jgi:hypothetical protein